MSKKDKTDTAVANDETTSKKESKSPAKKESKKSKEKERITVLEEAVQEEKDRYLRLFAEFENYKKRTGKERMDLFKTASQDVMVSLLPVLDDFDRALKEIERNEDDDLFKGVELISNKMKDILKQKGLAVIEVENGTSFDAEIHEAVTQIPAPSEDMKGKIIDVIEKGYLLGEKIIRYPKVVIGN